MTNTEIAQIRSRISEIIGEDDSIVALERRDGGLLIRAYDNHNGVLLYSKTAYTYNDAGDYVREAESSFFEALDYHRYH